MAAAFVQLQRRHEQGLLPAENLILLAFIARACHKKLANGSKNCSLLLVGAFLETLAYWLTDCQGL